MAVMTVKIKRIISHTIIVDVDAQNKDDARVIALEKVATLPVNYHQLPPSTIIEKHEIEAVNFV